MKILTSPARLQLGDTVSIVSPSAGLAQLFPHRLEAGIKALNKIGLKVKVEKHALNRHDWVSGTPEERVADLHSAFSNPDVKAIICSIGGDHSNQLLKYLDFELIKNNPKIFVGYSDISVLHYAFASQSNLRTFYGPCLISEFGEYPDVLEYTKKSFTEVLMNSEPAHILPSKQWTDEFLDWFNPENYNKPRVLHDSTGYEWWKPGKARGLIVGGCVPSINHTIGTKYWLDPKGCIFFIDIPEGGPGKQLDLSSLDSYLADLDNNGVFKNIRGLIIGRPYRADEDGVSQIKEMFLRYASEYDYPILFNANIGHCSPIITLPLGIETTIDSEASLFETKESGVI